MITATIRNINAKTVHNTRTFTCNLLLSNSKPKHGINARASVSAVVIPIAVALLVEGHHELTNMPISTAIAKAIINGTNFNFILLD